MVYRTPVVESLLRLFVQLKPITPPVGRILNGIEECNGAMFSRRGQVIGENVFIQFVFNFPNTTLEKPFISNVVIKDVLCVVSSILTSNELHVID